MSKLIIKLFLKEKDNTRHKSAIVSGITGIILNILLSVSKIIIGYFTNSIAIVADAVNNLSDASSNIVTIFGAKISSKPVDKDHPYGHGRMEYISTLIVSFMIILMGLGLIKSSIEKLIEPPEIKFSIASIVVLILGICVKLWMAYFNNVLYKKYNNTNMKAVKQDSLNDCFATSAAIISLLICKFTGFNYSDGIFGIIVAVIVLISGIKLIIEVTNNLLGKAPDKETIDRIEKIIMNNDIVTGVHDIQLHDYGAGKIIGSAHAEVPTTCDIVSVHDVIDKAETKILEEMNITICIHMDPI